MSTQTPPGDVSVTAPGCSARGAPLPVGRSRRFCSPGLLARCIQSAPPKPLLWKSSCRAAGHGWKTSFTNAPSAKAATWRAIVPRLRTTMPNASALEVSGPCCEETIPTRH
jgi:hypothetical protein